MPLKYVGILGILLATVLYGSWQPEHTPFTLILHPAGDAQHPGRSLEHNYERGITLQCAERLKSELEQRIPIRIMLTRLPGDILQPLQQAHLANRIGADLYISLHFYRESGPKPTIALYTFSYGDDFIQPIQGLQLSTYDTVHRKTQRKTDAIAQQLYQSLCTFDVFNVHKPQALPHAALIGVGAPAIAIEGGLKNDDWNSFIPLLVKAVENYINKT